MQSMAEFTRRFLCLSSHAAVGVEPHAAKSAVSELRAVCAISAVFIHSRTASLMIFLSGYDSSVTATGCANAHARSVGADKTEMQAEIGVATVGARVGEVPHLARDLHAIAGSEEERHSEREP